MDFLLTNKHIVNLLVGLLSLLVFVFLAKKYKLSKHQVLIFILLTLFWTSIAMIRSYRKVFMVTAIASGGLGLSEIAAVTVVSIYGLISIFLRLPIFIVTDYFKSRKFFIGLSILFISLTSIIVYLNPTYTTMYASSLAIGIGASFLALFNVLFADTFTKEQAIISVSILSIAPLLAEFIVAPIQYIYTSAPINYGILWLISGLIAILSFILMLFIKDNKEKVVNFSLIKFKEIITNKSFIALCVLGVFISFIKFSTSGANFISFAKLADINMSPLGLAYSDVIFSLFQLVAGILMGTYLKNKIGVKYTFILGLTINLLFFFVIQITINPVIIFLTYSLNGFGYGINYNLLIGLVMQPFDKNYRELSMGIYQTFFAIGIYYGDKVYAYIFKLLSSDTIYDVYRNVYLLTGIITILLIIFVTIFFSGKNKKFIEV
jgi:hypothetical protein